MTLLRVDFQDFVYDNFVCTILMYSVQLFSYKNVYTILERDEKSVHTATTYWILTMFFLVDCLYAVFITLVCNSLKVCIVRIEV